MSERAPTMRSDHTGPVASGTYPTGTVRALLASDLVTTQTRAVLLARLDGRRDPVPRVLDDTAFATLRAVCARLIPQPERPDPVDLAAAIHDRLARGEGNGWRYATMPPDREAYALGLRGTDECARAMFGAEFVALDGRRQDEVLRAVQRGEPLGGSWAGLPADRFFEELLAEVAECYYSHPLAQEEIGYAGFADARGWHAVGLDQLEPHEPREEGNAGATQHAEATGEQDASLAAAPKVP